MIIAYSVLALFVAWIWIEYFRLIDVFEKEKYQNLIVAFVLGGGAVQIVLWLHPYFLDLFQLQFNGEFLNDFLYCTLQIGLLEEIAKIIPFLLFLLLFPKAINEPLDYLIFISLSALGFSAVENVLYMDNYGAGVISGRAILSTVGHMFDTALFAYGIILFRFRNYNFLVIPLFLAFAAVSHGFYDFWLMYNGGDRALVTIAYFLVSISWFAVILNNALNNSPFFTYKKVVRSGKIIGRLMAFYVLIYIIQFVLVAIEGNDVKAAVIPLVMTSIITGISVVRLSRFKLLQGHWEKLKPELPFGYSQTESGYGKKKSNFRIKGDTINELFIAGFYHEYFTIRPLSKHHSYLQHERTAYLEKKVYLPGDVPYFIVKIFHSEKDGPSYTMAIRAKMAGKTRTRNNKLIVALLKIENEDVLDNKRLNAFDFQFKEWVVLERLY